MYQNYFYKTFGPVTFEWCFARENTAFDVKISLIGIGTLYSGLLHSGNSQVPFSFGKTAGSDDILKGKLKFRTDASGQPSLSIDLKCEPYSINESNYLLSSQDSKFTNEILKESEAEKQSNFQDVVEPSEPEKQVNFLEFSEQNEPKKQVDSLEIVELSESIKPRDSIENMDAIALTPETVFANKGEYQDLFPFVYMRVWSEISPDLRQRRFVEYDIKKVPHTIQDGSLYNNLVAIKNDGSGQIDARVVMEKEARHFINGDSATKTPAKSYQGQFLQNISNLKGYIKNFSRLNKWLRQQQYVDLQTLKYRIEKILGLKCWSAIEEYIRGKDFHLPELIGANITENTEGAITEYMQEKDKVWQNFFALIILPEYRPHLLEELTQTLVMCSLMERLVATHADLKTSEQILEAAKATIILPQDIFPLPPASKDESPSVSKPTEWVEPYAIGELQIVRQRLLRYELGEVAYIENVLKGERKETTQRKLNRINESITNVSSQLEDNETDIHGTSSDLLNETQRTLATITTNFKNFNTSYGSPTTVKFDGSWSVGNEPDKPDQEYIRKFAKDITTRTANRIARYMSQVRSLSTLDETEETVIHAFDNTGGTSNVIGIYRWINKIYAVHVVNYGYRLMAEFMVKNPAKSYIDSAFHLQSISFDEPIAPGELKLKNDSETDPDKPNFNNDSYKAIWKNYAEMAIRYDVKDIQPPPAEFKIVTTAFKDGEPITIKKIVVPEGYRAKSAWVTCVLSGDNPMDLKGFVGKNDFILTQTQRQKEIEKMSDEDSAIAACVLCSTEQTFLPLPPKESPSQSSKYCVSIQVKCELSDEKFQEWQIKTYNAILDGYRKKRAEYYAKADVSPTGIESHNPRENRNIENNELKKCCTRQLLRQHSKLVGDAEKGSDNNEPSEFDVNQLRYIEVFEQAFEWYEMIYQFYPQWEEQNNQARRPLTALNHYSGTDPLFTSFLQAGSARVLVPVRPDHTMLVLYYLSSGTIWPGTNALTPTINDNKYVSLVNELKLLSQVEHECKYVSKPWEITIPTSMIVLQDSSQLPQFQPKVCR